VGEKSLYTHTVCTQNQLTVVQQGSHRFHSLFPNEIDVVMIIKASSVVAKNVKPHEESLESEAVFPNFHE
jgi:hypothetical protein